MFFCLIIKSCIFKFCKKKLLFTLIQVFKQLCLPMKKINKSNNSLLTDGPIPCSHYHIASSHSISTLKLPVQKKKNNNENTIDIQNKSKADQTEKTLFDCMKLETKPYEKISLTIPLKNMKHLEDFDVGPKVGKGKFSEVFLARYNISIFVFSYNFMS